MNADQFVTLLLGFGVGGAVGALATLYLAATRLGAAWEALRDAFVAAFPEDPPPPHRGLYEAFSQFEERVEGLLVATARARRALTRRS